MVEFVEFRVSIIVQNTVLVKREIGDHGNKVAAGNDSNMVHDVFNVLRKLGASDDRDKIGQGIIVVIVDYGDVVDIVIFGNEKQRAGVLGGIESADVGILKIAEDVQRLELCHHVFSRKVRRVLAYHVPIFIQENPAFTNQRIHVILDCLWSMVLCKEVHDVPAFYDPEG